MKLPIQERRVSIARVIEPPTRLDPARLSVASGQHLRWEKVGDEDGLVAV